MSNLYLYLMETCIFSCICKLGINSDSTGFICLVLLATRAIDMKHLCGLGLSGSFHVPIFHMCYPCSISHMCYSSGILQGCFIVHNRIVSPQISFQLAVTVV